MDCIWPVAATLGEGPLWDERTSMLWFVDIKQGMIHRCDAQGHDRSSVAVGGAPSFIVPIAAGGFVVGNGHRLDRFEGNRVTGTIAALDMRADNRLNDATTDPAGRLWFGSMDNREAEPTGALHVLADGAIGIAGGRCTITNGPTVSGDGRWLYHVDTLAGTIWRFDIAGRTTLDHGEPFVQIDPDAGNPDGVTIDAEDHVWVGLWGGWAARRYAPDGRLVDEVRLPAANVTKLAFGGPDFKTAFATTARASLDAAALEDQPLAGGVFAFPVAVPGRPVTPAAIAP